MLAPGQRIKAVFIPKALIVRGSRTRIGGTIDSAERDRLNTSYPMILRPGLILARNSNNGRWYICWGTTLSADEAAAQTTLSVATGTGNDGRFDLSDPDSNADNIWIVGPGGIPGTQDLGALSGIAASTITVTNGLNVMYPSGSYVYRAPATTPYDADIAQGILYENVSVDAGFGADGNVQADILTHGIVDSNQLIGSINLWQGQLMDPTIGNVAHEITFEPPI